MKAKLLSLLIGTVTTLSVQAAPVFTITPPSGWDGSFSIKLAGYESFTNGIALGSQNYGVVRVTSILDGGGNNVLWSDGDGGAEITGIFSGITLSQIIPVFGGATVVSTGGTSSFFINPFGSLNTAGGFAQGAVTGYTDAGCAANTNCYDGISNVAAGGSFLNANWVSGVLDVVGDVVSTVTGSFISVTTPQSGFAAGFLSVTGGTYANDFDTNGFTFTTPGNLPADLRANNTFCTPGAACSASVLDAGGLPADGGWSLRIDDPINGSMRIPEPATLALTGLGLLAAAMVRRRKA